jgi:hypothetical protein
MGQLAATHPQWAPKPGSLTERLTEFIKAGKGKEWTASQMAAQVAGINPASVTALLEAAITAGHVFWRVRDPSPRAPRWYSSIQHPMPRETVQRMSYDAETGKGSVVEIEPPPAAESPAPAVEMPAEEVPAVRLEDGEPEAVDDPTPVEYSMFGGQWPGPAATPGPQQCLPPLAPRFALWSDGNLEMRVSAGPVTLSAAEVRALLDYLTAIDTKEVAP